MHYRFRTSVVLKMQLSLGLLTLEMGILSHPLQESYTRYGLCITDGLFKSLWKKVDMFGITVEVCNILLLQPRKRDKWTMIELKRKGHSTEDIRRLNMVRVHQQVSFLSDVLGVSGKSLGKKYLTQRGVGEQWYTFRFPKENPLPKYFLLCQKAIAQLILVGGIMDRLGNFKAPPHIFWEWRLDNEETRLLHIKGEVMDVYKPLQVGRYATTPT